MTRSLFVFLCFAVVNPVWAHALLKADIQLAVTYTNVRTGTVSLTKIAPTIKGRIYRSNVGRESVCTVEVMGKRYTDSCLITAAGYGCLNVNLPALARDVLTRVERYSLPGFAQQAQAIVLAAPYKPARDDKYYQYNSGYCFAKWEHVSILFMAPGVQDESVHLLIKMGLFKN